MKILLIIIILSLFFNSNLHNLKNNIDYCFNNNFKVVLSLFRNHNKYLEYYKIINFIHKNDKEKSIFKKSKLIIKTTNLPIHNRKQIFFDIVKYAKNKNIFVWIGSNLPSYIQNDVELYYDTLKIYNNIGITLSSFNTNVHEYVDEIIIKKGHIRLIKGKYYGNVNNKKIVNNNYYINAKKILKSNIYNCLATHDFKILNKLRKEKINFNNTELSFFFNSNKLIKENIKKFDSMILCKSFYFSYGNLFEHLLNNLFNLNFRILLSSFGF